MKIVVRHEGKVVSETNITVDAEITVGRQPENDIVLNEIKASRMHGKFVRSGEQVSFVDLGSGNGTFVKGRKIEASSPVVLAFEDEIVIGSMILNLAEGEAVDVGATTASAPSPREAAVIEAGKTGILSGSGGMAEGKSYGIGAEKITVGRTPENNIQIMDPLSSRSNTEIRRDGDKYIVKDLDSTNGTFLNDHKLSGEDTLCEGDIIRIGEVRFTFSLVDESSAPAVPQPQANAATPSSPARQPEIPQGSSKLAAPIVIAVIVVVGFFVWQYFIKGDGNTGPQPTDPTNGSQNTTTELTTAPESSASTFPVKLDSPKRMDMQVTLEKTGNVHAWKQSDHMLAVGQKVEEVYAKNNQRVKVGDKLVRMEMTDSLKASRNKLRASFSVAKQDVEKALRDVDKSARSLKNAEDNLKIAQESYDRNKQLFDNGNLLQAEWDSIRTKRNNARTEVDVKKKELEQVKRTVKQLEESVKQVAEDMKEVDSKIKDLTVTTKMDGIVTRLDLKKGYTVTAANSVISIIEYENAVKVVVAVPEDDIALVKEKARAEVWLSRASNDVFSGVVTMIPATAKQRNYDVELQVENRNKHFRPGAQAMVRFIVKSKPDCLAVPADCLDSDKRGEFYLYKFKVSDKTVKQVYVKKGAEKVVDGTKYVELISDGITEKDRIVIEGHRNLRDGAAVEPK